MEIRAFHYHNFLECTLKDNLTAKHIDEDLKAEETPYVQDSGYLIKFIENAAQARSGLKTH